MTSFASGSKYTREEFRFLTAVWVCQNRRPFRIIRDPCLNNIFGLLNPLVNIHSPSTVAYDVHNIYVLSEMKVKSFLAVSNFCSFLTVADYLLEL